MRRVASALNHKRRVDEIARPAGTLAMPEASSSEDHRSPPSGIVTGHGQQQPPVRDAHHQPPGVRARLQLPRQERPPDPRSARDRAAGEPRRAAGLCRCRLCQRRIRRRCRRWAATPPAGGNTAIIPIGSRCASGARPGTSSACSTLCRASAAMSPACFRRGSRRANSRWRPPIALIDATGIRSGTSRHARLSGARGAVTLLKSNVEIERALDHADVQGEGRQARREGRSRSAPRSGHQGAAAFAGPAPVCLSGCAIRSGRSASATSTRSFATSRRANFRCKDFRTLRASVNVVETLARTERAEGQTRRKRQVKQAIQVAADDLANTVTICRKSYVHEAVVDAFEHGKLSGEKSPNGRLSAGAADSGGRRQRAHSPLSTATHHAFFRKSLTRTALPCERGTSPDALMTTSQLTPRRALI